MSKISNVLKTFIRCVSTNPTIDLKSILASKILVEQEKIKKFRKAHGKKKIGEITVDMIYGGMRGVNGLVCETSILDPVLGIRFRGFSIPELQEKLPKAHKGEQPLPEGIFWLMLTSELPTQAQVNWLSKQWAERSSLPNHVQVLLHNLPASLHPMAQLSCAITALHHESKFSRAYYRGIPKRKYWEYIYEDAMDLIAKITVIAAIIFRNTYKARSPVIQIDPTKDWAYNFTQMLGFDKPDMIELIRLYLTLHCDHEGGNVTAHTTHLVGSALSDCYLSYAAGINGLAGPLHGLANQEALIWLHKLRDELGENVHDHHLATYIRSSLSSGKIIPGYGHAVLRKTDPRFLCLRDFALRHLANDPLFKLCSQSYKIIPPILAETGKVSNPWPNVDAHSGVLLQHYGLKEMEFYTVMFAVSRALGVLASLIWSRGLGMPIERPKSMTTKAVMKAVGISDTI